MSKLNKTTQTSSASLTQDVASMKQFPVQIQTWEDTQNVSHQFNLRSDQLMSTLYRFTCLMHCPHQYKAMILQEVLWNLRLKPALA